MEIFKFINFLYKRISVIIIVPIVAIIITFFLVRNLPDSYISRAQISTGIINQTDDAVLTGQAPPAIQEVEQQFSNMVQIVQMNKVLDLVSYKLILNDLTAKTPFREPSKALLELSPNERNWLRNEFQKRYIARQPLTLMTDEEDKLNRILTSMNYDSESLKEKLRVFRVGQSDFINVEFESEDRRLTAFITNAICSEFIEYYAGTIRDSERKSVDYLSRLLMEKQRNLNEKMNQLKEYKIRNRVLNLPEQARILYGQMVIVQGNREKADKDIVSLAGAINDINKKFTPKERQYLEATVSSVNSDIVAYKEQLKAMTDVFIKEGFDSGYKETLDSVRSILDEKIQAGVDQNIFSPLAAKQDLVSQKINLQTQLDINKHSVASLQKEYNTLTSQFSRLVPFEASIQSFERDIEIASQEYLDILDKYNLTSMQSNFSVKLKQSQLAMPGTRQPSKKMLLVIVSGIIGFVFVILVFFILFFFESAITEPKELANVTNFPVLGYIEKLKTSTTDIHTLWNWNVNNGFRDQLRSIRFEISNELGNENMLALAASEITLRNGSFQSALPENNKILSLTSFTKGEGKTFLSISLAYAFALTNKNILLIDGNFSNPSLSRSIHAELDFEDYLQGNIHETDFKRRGISVLGNKGEGSSLLEITDQSTLEERLLNLKSAFDIIIVETPSLKELDKAKEWFMFTDKIAGVFEANKKVTEQQKHQTDYLHSINHNKFIGWIINKVEVNQGSDKKRWFKKRDNGAAVS